MLELPNDLTQNDILTQVLDEYNRSKNFVDNKRDLFRKRFDLYNNIADQENKVYVRLIFSVMQTLLALYYNDEITVKFTGRQIGDDALAKNLQNLAKFDYEEMKLEDKKYQVQRDRFFYGVGIEISDGRDPIRKVPKVRVVNPLTWIPDTSSDVNYGYRYHGFDVEMSEYEFSEEAGYDMDAVAQLMTDMEWDEFQNQVAIGAVRGLSDYNNSRNGGVNRVFSIYHHYTIINGIKYLITTGNQRTLILRVEEIQPVGEIEKKDPNEVEFPVVVRHYSPLRGDAYGVSIPDILEDKQRMTQLFMNLNRIKAEHEARGDMFLYDPEAIKNINDIKVPTMGPKYIKADLKSNPNPITEVQRSQIKSDSYNMPNIIQQQAQFDIGMDNQALGIAGDKSITATENQRVQKNANLKLVLGSRIDNRAEKKFWNVLRFRLYKEFFKPNDQKNIRLNNGFGMIPYTVKRKDFLSQADIDITIMSKSDEEAMMEKEKAGYMATVNFVLQNPESPKISKTFALRKLYKLQGIKEEETFVLVPQSYEEMQAQDDIQLLNRDEMPADIDNLQEDHMTYIVMYQQALDTEAKWKAIDKRKQAYIASGQIQAQGAPVEGGALAATQAQLTSGAISQANKQENGAASLQDVL